jgi:hypothetical protein
MSIPGLRARGITAVPARVTATALQMVAVIIGSIYGRDKRNHRAE